MGEDPRRRDDEIVTRIDQQFRDFLDRYERDHEETKEWRARYDIIQKDHTDILNEIAPNYKRGMWVLGLITCGSIGIAIKDFWEHLHLLWK